MVKHIQLAKGKEKALNRLHPWIFSGAIAREDQAEEGDLVEVLSFDGKRLAIGHYQSPKASIRVKVLTFGYEDFDDNWWRKQVHNAIQLRKDLGYFDSKETNAFRLIYGEGDGLPGLIVDQYDHNLVIQCHTLGMYNMRHKITSILCELLGDDVSTIYDKSGDSLKGHDVESGFLIGDTVEADIRENGSSFRVNWVTGQKTGFFLDQRDNRALLGSMSDGKKVLNAFAYSGGFSVFALKGGAAHVDSVDLSEKACELADVNAEINGSADKHRSIASDVQAFLKDMDKDYDIVILDPPAFAKRRKAVHKAVQAYKRLNATAMKNMKPGTLLFTFSCSQNVTTQMFTDTIRAAAIEVGRPVQILQELRQPNDHPENIFFPEGHYLKGLLLRIG